MIESYRFGKITVNGKEYHRDIIIFPDHIKKNWWREEGHRLRARGRLLVADGEALDVGEEQALVSEDEAVLAYANPGFRVTQAPAGVVGIPAAPCGEIHAVHAGRIGKADSARTRVRGLIVNVL